MVFTLEGLFTELEKFYYYSIQFNKKRGTTEKQYECIVIIYLSERGERNTKTFSKISFDDLFQSIEGFVSEMKRKKEAH